MKLPLEKEKIEKKDHNTVKKLVMSPQPSLKKITTSSLSPDEVIGRSNTNIDIDEKILTKTTVNAFKHNFVKPAIKFDKKNISFLKGPI